MYDIASMLRFGKRTQSGGAIVQNEPNFPRARLPELARVGGSCKTNPILRLRIGDRPAASGPRRPIMQNEANLPCVGSPSPTDWGNKPNSEGGLCDVTSMPRFGKQSQTRASRDIWEPSVGQALVRNKANLPGTTGRDKCSAARELW